VTAVSRWQDHAACKGVAPRDGTSNHPFFLERGHSSRVAKQTCATCPVREVCLAEALSSGERFGIWGGVEPRARKRLVQVQREGPPLLAG
jgi:WhiB family redox-sensing transcriptional regulator